MQQLTAQRRLGQPLKKWPRNVSGGSKDTDNGSFSSIKLDIGVQIPKSEINLTAVVSTIWSYGERGSLGLGSNSVVVWVGEGKGPAVEGDAQHGLLGLGTLLDQVSQCVLHVQDQIVASLLGPEKRRVQY